ncbi:MAG: hypothetical protein AAGK98_17905 [Pseudomonadota bacterium]
MAQADFLWMTAKLCFVGRVEAMAMAVSYSSERAFEVYILKVQLHGANLALTRVGQAHGLAHFRTSTIELMRLEKSDGH